VLSPNAVKNLSWYCRHAETNITLTFQLADHMNKPSYFSAALTTVAAVLSLSFAALPAAAQTKGAGSTFARDLMARWVADYGNGTVSYAPVGSSAGVQQLTDKSVDFAITDRALQPVQLERAGLRQYPLAASAVTVVVNLPNLPKGQTIRLNGDLLADIYSGNITSWDHSLIKALNPNLATTNLPITPIFRTDGSGQTYAFTLYLSRYNRTWARNFGADTKVSFKTGEGKAGGAAMLAAVKAKPGAIGYDALGEAVKSGLVMPQLQNASSNYVSPSVKAVSEALGQARWDTASAAFVPPNSADLDGSAGSEAWPISAVTYALVPAVDKGNAMPFLAAAVAQGDKGVSDNSFVAIPAAMKEVVRKAAGK
jgi:phosphate transport system substrate-binding protein